MANRKISDLTALTTPATGDLLPIVDISEAASADKNKKITFGELFASIPLGTAAAPSVAFEGDSNTGIYSPGADTIATVVNGAEAHRTDSSGRLLVGLSSARTNIDYHFGTSSASFQVERADALPCVSIVSSYDSGTTSAPAYLTLARAGSTALGSTTIVANGNRIGEINFSGSDGTDFIIAASIRGEVDGTPGANDMPGRLVFSTTADGAASPTEAMRIKSTQIINLSNAPTHADNTAATAAGLAVGDVYKTVLGVLMIRF
jgi:hypothetical protein